MDEVLDPVARKDDKHEEQALRPRTLNEFIGQGLAREQLAVMLEAASRLGARPDHVLLSGPPGTGKTTLAQIVAEEVGMRLSVVNGPMIDGPERIVFVLTSLSGGEVLFIDEVHRVARAAEEMLYTAMEDGCVNIVGSTGATRIDLPPFTVIGATTRTGLVSEPLRARFGLHIQTDFYSEAELALVVERSSKLLGLEVSPGAAGAIASRSRGTPRIANRLLRRARDWAVVRGDGILDTDSVCTAMNVYQVDTLGLDRLDRLILETLCNRFSGGPVGVKTLATAIGEEVDVIESSSEPYLVRSGLLDRTARGRVATPRAWEHLGQVAPKP